MRAVLAVFLFIVLTGCGIGAGRGHAPPPTITVEVFGPDEFMLNGTTLDRDMLESRLQDLGQIGRNNVTNTTRSRVRIIADRGGADATARKISQYCTKVGLVNVFFEAK